MFRENKVAKAPAHSIQSTATSTSTSTNFTSNAIHDIDPPLTAVEQQLDRYLAWAHSPLVQVHGVRFLTVSVLLLVGSLFFFFIGNFHNFCQPSHDCEPRNWLMNWNIQLICFSFTVKAVICLPWRVVTLFHSLQWYPHPLKQYHNNDCWLFPKRSNALGLDWRGQVIDTGNEFFYLIPHRPRMLIACLNIGDCLFQLLNQVTRIVFYNYALATTRPGSLFVDAFWPFAMLCGVVGGQLTDYWGNKLRKQSQQSQKPFLNNNDADEFSHLTSKEHV